VDAGARVAQSRRTKKTVDRSRARSNGPDARCLLRCDGKTSERVILDSRGAFSRRRARANKRTNERAIDGLAEEDAKACLIMCVCADYYVRTGPKKREEK